jgi:hypothetical protein
MRPELDPHGSVVGGSARNVVSRALVEKMQRPVNRTMPKVIVLPDRMGDPEDPLFLISSDIFAGLAATKAGKPPASLEQVFEAPEPMQASERVFGKIHGDRRRLEGLEIPGQMIGTGNSPAFSIAADYRLQALVRLDADRQALLQHVLAEAPLTVDLVVQRP